jgi:hypothetical protein
MTPTPYRNTENIHVNSGRVSVMLLQENFLPSSSPGYLEHKC